MLAAGNAARGRALWTRPRRRPRPNRRLSGEAAGVLGVRDVRFAHRKGAEELFGGLTHDSRPAATALTASGASTLLYLVGLLLTPTGGQVLLDGEPVSEAFGRRACGRPRRRGGFVFQDSELDPSRRVIDSVLEPALYAGHLREDKLQRARALLEQFGLGIVPTTGRGRCRWAGAAPGRVPGAAAGTRHRARRRADRELGS